MSGAPDPATTDSATRERRRERAWPRRAWRAGRAWFAARSRIARLAIGAAALACAGAAFVLAGAAPIAASAGHSAPVAWLLHFAMQRAVAVRSLGARPPPLDDPALVLRGAGHYASYCVACHGAPGVERSILVRHMTPPPPVLDASLREWTPRELHWIVLHGVKYTAMPAWIASRREDEPWALVAFLRVLPDLDAAAYRRLAYGDGAPAAMHAGTTLARPSMGAPLDAQVANCTRCHGADGLGREHGAFPVLAGQSARYLESALRAYRDGRRASGFMQPVAAALDDRTIAALAARFAALPGPAPAPPRLVATRTGPDVERARRGRELVVHGAPAQGVPACVGCHASDAPRDPAYPRLDIQHAEYVAQQLRLFRDGVRGGGPRAPLMTLAARRLTDEQIAAIAAYVDAGGAFEGEPRD